jgi:hypothetical protein
MHISMLTPRERWVIKGWGFYVLDYPKGEYFDTFLYTHPRVGHF